MLLIKGNNKNRKIIFETQIVNVAEVLQNGVTTYPDIAVVNFMKAKHGKYKSYEDLEMALTKSIPNNSIRKGWSLAKRIDRYGTNMSWTHFTVDWFDKYSDFLKRTSGPSTNASKSYQNMMKLKSLKKELIIKIDKKYYRPLEIDYLKGDPRKALKKLNYKLKHDLKDLVKDMLDSDIRLFKKKK